MATHTNDVGIAPLAGGGLGRCVLVGAILVALASAPTLALATDLSAADSRALVSGSNDPGPAPGTGDGLTLVSPLDGLSAGAAGFAVPCLGLGAAERPLSTCLGLGGGLDRTPAVVGFGLHYGHDGWLRLGAGVGVQATGGDGASGGGLTWAPSQWDDGMEPEAPGQRLSGSLSALVDVNALTGLDFGGMRPFLGADVSVGQVHAGPGSRSGSGLLVTETTAHGMSWGATLGSNVAVTDGITLDFAYRYAGQEATGPLDPGLGMRMGLGGVGASGEGGDATNHGMSIGLRLSF